MVPRVIGEGGVVNCIECCVCVSGLSLKYPNSAGVLGACARLCHSLVLWGSLDWSTVWSDLILCSCELPCSGVSPGMYAAAAQTDDVCDEIGVVADTSKGDRAWLDCRFRSSQNASP